MRKMLAFIAVTAVAMVACGSGREATRSPSSASGGNAPMRVEVVNYELLAGESNRFMVGLVLPDNTLVAYGTVQMRFQQLTTSGQPIGQVSDVVVGTYLPVPGTRVGDPTEAPQAIAPSTVKGVYELEGVRFLQPGPWVVEVAARIQGRGVAQGSATFVVVERPRVPGVGEEAPRSDNPVIGDDVAAQQIDSRAQGGSRVPDPSLHQVSIADAVRQGEPTVVVFSTPVYCVSRFCGPVTDMVSGLQERFGDRAAFIHVEIWKDYQANVANDAAIQWLQQDGEVTEPWLFVIGADGKIAYRWDNLFTATEVSRGIRSVLRSS